MNKIDIGLFFHTLISKCDYKLADEYNAYKNSNCLGMKIRQQIIVTDRNAIFTRTTMPILCWQAWSSQGHSARIELHLDEYHNEKIRTAQESFAKSINELQVYFINRIEKERTFHQITKDNPFYEEVKQKYDGMLQNVMLKDDEVHYTFKGTDGEDYTIVTDLDSMIDTASGRYSYDQKLNQVDVMTQEDVKQSEDKMIHDQQEYYKDLLDKHKNIDEGTVEFRPVSDWRGCSLRQGLYDYVCDDIRRIKSTDYKTLYPGNKVFDRKSKKWFCYIGDYKFKEWTSATDKDTETVYTSPSMYGCRLQMISKVGFICADIRNIYILDFEKLERGNIVRDTKTSACYMYMGSCMFTKLHNIDEKKTDDEDVITCYPVNASGTGFFRVDDKGKWFYQCDDIHYITDSDYGRIKEGDILRDYKTGNKYVYQGDYKFRKLHKKKHKQKMNKEKRPENNRKEYRRI